MQLPVKIQQNITFTLQDVCLVKSGEFRGVKVYINREKLSEKIFIGKSRFSASKWLSGQPAYMTLGGQDRGISFSFLFLLFLAKKSGAFETFSPSAAMPSLGRKFSNCQFSKKSCAGKLKLERQRVWKKGFDPKKCFQSHALYLLCGIYKAQLLCWGTLGRNMDFQIPAFRLSPGAKSQRGKTTNQKNR